MGGCRCFFRNCQINSANNPGRHFFHFPIKNEELLKQWIKYAKAEKLLTLSIKQMRNKVVCDSHFRDECYMNYKKNKLTRTAVPTLMPVGSFSDLVLDYESSENPAPIKLPKPTAKHLIPPEEEIKSSTSTTYSKPASVMTIIEDQYLTDLCNNDEELVEQLKTESILNTEKSFTLVTLDNVDQDDNIIFADLSDEGASASPPLKKLKKINRPNPSAPKILNRSANKNLILSTNNSTSTITPKTFQKNPTTHKSYNNLIKISNDDIKKEKPIVISNDVSNVKIFTEKEMNRIFSLHKIEYENKILDLEEQLKAKQEEIKKVVTQVQTVSTSKEQQSLSLQKTLTKAQLFNSIKKYLSSSMSSLVRMEMFGGPEREWKPDEKQASIELLRLGDNVFKYFSDEWRFRLPSKKEVEKWISESENFEDEENL